MEGLVIQVWLVRSSTSRMVSQRKSSQSIAVERQLTSDEVRSLGLLCFVEVLLINQRPRLKYLNYNYAYLSGELYHSFHRLRPSRNETARRKCPFARVDKIPCQLLSWLVRKLHVINICIYAVGSDASSAEFSNDTHKKPYRPALL